MRVLENSKKRESDLDIYRLDFNEENQTFHLDNYTHKAGTNGWVTICENCTDYEYKILLCYANIIPNKKLTEEYLLKCLSEVKIFLDNMIQYGLSIERN